MWTEQPALHHQRVYGPMLATNMLTIGLLMKNVLILLYPEGSLEQCFE